MAKTKKATVQQIFKQYLKVEKAKSIAREESRKLEEIAQNSSPFSGLVQHEGNVFRVSTNGRPWPRSEIRVEQVAELPELERLIK